MLPSCVSGCIIVVRHTAPIQLPAEGTIKIVQIKEEGRSTEDSSRRRLENKQCLIHVYRKTSPALIEIDERVRLGRAV